MIRRTLLRWFAPVLLAGTLSLPTASAQTAPPQPAATAAHSDLGDYAIAGATTLLVLLIVFLPRRWTAVFSS